MILPFSEPVIHSENNITKISGDWLASTVQSAGATADGRLLASDGQIDWSQLGRVDSAGAFALIQALGASDLGNDVPDRLRRVLDIVAPAIQEHATKKPKKSYGFFTRLEAVWEIGGRGCHRRICVIQALDVDAAEPGADGPDCEEDEALSQ